MMKRLILPITLVFLTNHSLQAASTINFTGAGTLLSGTGTAADLNVGDSVIYTNAGADSLGNSFDVILTLNSIGGSTVIDATRSGGFITLIGTADSFGEFTLSFSSGGNAVALTDVTAFNALDVDSTGSAANNSDVFGLALTGLESSINRGSALVNAGFVQNVGQPTSGFDFSRLDEDSGSGDPLTFNGEGSVNTENLDNATIYNYNNETFASFDFIFGTTSTAPSGTLGSITRGVSGSLEFSGAIAPVPEPSSAILLALGACGFIIRRKR